MATREWKRLKAKQVENEMKPGRHSDGGGLYLSISKDGSRRRWVFLFRERRRGPSGPGRLRELGLGSARAVSLKRARDLADRLRHAVAEGRNPADELKPVPQMPLFREIADDVITIKKKELRNAKSAAQWEMTLTRYCAPIRDMPVDKITTADIVAVLKPMWSEKPETAQRLRGRIEKVLTVAKSRQFRTGENPALLSLIVGSELAKPRKLSRGHHKALPYGEIPDFCKQLRQLDYVASNCLEFLILTAARSGEAMGAEWPEIHLEKRIWIIPASRMKAGREHCVPLSDRACEILKQMEVIKSGAFVFPGRKADRPLSVMALAMVLRRLKTDATVHGFRSGFRDWAAENEFAFEIAEAALAHTIRNQVAAAYLRTKFIEQRRPMMSAWAAFCEGAKN